MSHPTPWQLELHALGETVPTVAAHLPCLECQLALTELTDDPGPVPLLIERALAPRSAPSTPLRWIAAIAVVGTAIPIAAGLIAWNRSTPEGPPDPTPAQESAETAPMVPTPTEPAPTEPRPRRTPMPSQVRRGVPHSITFKGEGHAYAPVWSRDGEHLAFEVNNFDDRSDLYVFSASTGRAEKVNLPGGGGPFGGSQLVMNAVWHPAGIVVFEGSNTGGQFRLYYFQPGGGAASEMISSSALRGDLTFPTIDTAGQRLAFIADATGGGDLRIRHTDTGQIRTVLQTPEAEISPTFSPDGDLVYTRKSTEGEDIWHLDLTDGAETLLAGGPEDQIRPTFAGDTLVYFASSGEGWDLMADGELLASQVRLPLRSPPATSANGAWVAYTLEDPTQSGSLWLVRLDGSLAIEVPTGTTAAGEVALGANRRLAYTALPQSGADFRELYRMDVDEPGVRFD